MYKDTQNMYFERNNQSGWPTFPFEAVRSESPVRKVLLQDFYATFRLSQGDIFTQHHLMNYLGAAYRHTLGQEEFMALPGLMDELRPKIDALRPPPKHAPQSEEEIRGQFSAQWNWFQGSMSTDTTHGSPEIFANGLHELAKKVIRLDMTYITKNQGREADMGDGHFASLTREYLLDGRPSGSQIFDGMFAWMRQQFIDQSPLAVWDDLSNLADVWEYKHQGETFYPEAFTLERQESDNLRALGHIGLTVPPRT
jgi:hypothetical protein